MINHVVKNVTCEANTGQWKLGVSSKLRVKGKLIKQISIYFTPGSANQVQVQIRKGGAILIPDHGIVESTPAPIFGDFITGDSQEFWFPMETEIKKSETIEVYYRNLDATNTHDIMVRYELHGLPTPKSTLRT